MPTNKPTPLLRRFEFKQGRSNKFWEAWTEDKIAVTHWGRIGTAGAYQRKDFRTPFTAEEHIRNAIREKLAKGYVEVSVSPTLVAADKWTPVQPPVSSTVKQEEVPDIILERIEPERKQKRAFKL